LSQFTLYIMSSELKKNLLFIGLGLVIGGFLFLGGRQMGQSYSEKQWARKYEELEAIKNQEETNRQIEADLRKKSEERVKTLNDSIKLIRTQSTAFVKKETARINRKYEKLLETATDEELRQKLDSAFSK